MPPSWGSTLRTDPARRLPRKGSIRIKSREVVAMAIRFASIRNAAQKLTPMQVRNPMAEALGVGPPTLHTHLRGIRRCTPEFYAISMARRREQLARRHAAAVQRQPARSRGWHRKQAFLRYRAAHGCYPWESRGGGNGCAFPWATWERLYGVPLALFE